MGADGGAAVEERVLMEPWHSMLHAPHLPSPRDWGVPQKTYIAFLQREGHSHFAWVHTPATSKEAGAQVYQICLPLQNRLPA